MNESVKREHTDRDKQREKQRAADGRAIVNPVIKSFFRVGDPAVTARGFQPEAVPRRALPGGACGDSFLQRWFPDKTSAPRHTVFLKAFLAGETASG